VWRHELGTTQATTCSSSRTGTTLLRHDRALPQRHFVIIDSSSKLSSEVMLIDAGQPTAPPRWSSAAADLEYHVDHWGDRSSSSPISTRDFKVMTAPIDDPAAWSEFVSHESGRR